MTWRIRAFGSVASPEVLEPTTCCLEGSRYLPLRLDKRARAGGLQKSSAKGLALLISWVYNVPKQGTLTWSNV